jgi:malonate transporter and related proteins
MVFSVLQIVAPVFVIIAAGYAALRLGYLEAAALVGLSAFVLRVALPALVFNALAGAPVGETMDVRYLAGYCAGSLAVFAVGYLWARPEGRKVGVCAMQGLGMSVSNSGSVGFPIATLVIGAGAAPILAQTMIVENLVMLPLGLTVAEMAGRGTGRSGRCWRGSGGR